MTRKHIALNKRLKIGLILLSVFIFPACSLQKNISPETVASMENKGTDYIVMIHGLWNRSSRLADFEDYFTTRGYQVLNLNYPSTEGSIEELEKLYLRPVINAIPAKSEQKIHFVTHSMGGILLRQYFKKNTLKQAGKVVMISPPNQGSQWADMLKNHPFYKSIAGPAAYDLRTVDNAFLADLGPADFYLGIIAGDKSYFSGSEDTLPGADDGMVAIENMKLQGMKDMITIHDDHRGLTKNREAIRQTEYFLLNGSFNHNNI